MCFTETQTEREREQCLKSVHTFKTLKVVDKQAVLISRVGRTGEGGREGTPTTPN
jgi:hypothetical protein